MEAEPQPLKMIYTGSERNELCGKEQNATKRGQAEMGKKQQGEIKKEIS